MQKIKELVGKPVITYNEGKIIEDVDEVIYDPQKGIVLGLVVQKGGLFADTKVLPFRKIKAIGPDAITIESESAVVEAQDSEEIKHYLADKIDLRKKKIMTEGGQDLGKVADAVFDETSGRIECFEVTGGIFADAYSGRSYLPPLKITKIGEDVVFVPESTIEDFKKQEGGIKKAASLAEEKTKEYAGKAGAQARKLSRGMQDRYSETESGERARGIWSDIKNTANRWTNRTREQIEKERIEGALGRPVTRVIYDENDTVILDTGDIITHESIDTARESGVLDILLNSVYVGRPDFTKDELKAKK